MESEGKESLKHTSEEDPNITPVTDDASYITYMENGYVIPKDGGTYKAPPMMFGTVADLYDGPPDYETLKETAAYKRCLAAGGRVHVTPGGGILVTPKDQYSGPGSSVYDRFFSGHSSLREPYNYEPPVAAANGASLGGNALKHTSDGHADFTPVTADASSFGRKALKRPLVNSASDMADDLGKMAIKHTSEEDSVKDDASYITYMENGYVIPKDGGTYKAPYHGPPMMFGTVADLYDGPPDYETLKETAAYKRCLAAGGRVDVTPDGGILVTSKDQYSGPGSSVYNRFFSGHSSLREPYNYEPPVSAAAANGASFGGKALKHTCDGIADFTLVTADASSFGNHSFKY